MHSAFIEQAFYAVSNESCTLRFNANCECMYHFVFLRFVNFQPKAIKPISLFKLYLWGYYYISNKIDTHVNITIWVTHQQAVVSLAMRIISKSLHSRRLFCNSVRISQSSFSFLRPLCELNAFCVIQLSRGTSFPWLSECHAPNVLWKAAGELGILEIPMKLPQAVPNSLCCFTLVISLPQTEEDQTSTDQRSQQLPNWIWSVSSLQQYRSKSACNGDFFLYSCFISPHLFALCFVTLACFAFPELLSPISCQQDIVLWNACAKDDLIGMIRSTSLVGLSSSSCSQRNFH